MSDNGIKKRMVPVTSHHGSTFDIPVKLLDMVGWLNSKVNDIPTEFIDSAEIEFDLDDSDVEITYWRPETDFEVTERDRLEKLKQEDKDAKERADYERLKAKFEAHDRIVKSQAEDS